MVRDTLNRLADGRSLSFAETAEFIDDIASGEVSDAQIAAFLTALRVKGVGAEELAGCVSALRRHAVGVPHHQTTVFDCCGTGGDGSNTFNISTAAAFVVAACGVPTAKHGNRAVSSSCGSADLLEGAGANIQISPEHSARLLDEIGFCFLFAPLYHPATKRVAAVRRELAFRTIFNLLGPLLNPAHTTHQIVGTPSLEYARLLASVAGHFEGQQIHSYSNSLGIDEILPHGDNVVCTWSEEGVKSATLQMPLQMRNGFRLDHIQSSDRAVNLVMFKAVLAGEQSSCTSVTALNAALGLHCVGKVNSLDEGFEMAMDALRSGLAKSLFDNYVSMTREVA